MILKFLDFEAKDNKMRTVLKSERNMEKKRQYRTKQREELLGFFKKIPGRHMTAAEVCTCLHDEGIKIAQATVYRQMENMVDEGILSKYTADPSVPSCFTYLDKEGSCGEEPCHHCICEKCGRVIHVHCHEIDHLAEHLASEHGFVINPARTVFYGICAECAVKSDRGAE